MPHLVILGLGYTAGRLAHRLRRDGWLVTGIRRNATADVIAFENGSAVRAAISNATHILSSVPPDGDDDPVLIRYGADIAGAPATWVGYLSSTGVYGDTGGAWVDESAPLGNGRRAARTQADLAWGSLRQDMRRFRLPGIYGPGRSALERVCEGRAHRVNLADQIFSRVHVDDVASGVIASFHGPPGAYNLADDLPCAQNRVIEAACDLLGRAWPALLTLDEAGLSSAARAFYAENRRVSNMRACRLLDWRPAFSTYREGLAQCFGESGAASNSGFEKKM